MLRNLFFRLIHVNGYEIGVKCPSALAAQTDKGNKEADATHDVQNTGGRQLRINDGHAFLGAALSGDHVALVLLEIGNSVIAVTNHNAVNLNHAISVIGHDAHVLIVRREKRARGYGQARDACDCNFESLFDVHDMLDIECSANIAKNIFAVNVKLLLTVFLCVR